MYEPYIKKMNIKKYNMGVGVNLKNTHPQE